MKLDQKSVLLIGAALIVLIPFVLWWVLRLQRWFPLAVIQIFTGIALGPTILGELAPEVHATLFVGKVADGIKALAAISVCLFTFLAGTEADREVIRNAGRSVLAIGIGTLAATWAVGIGAGYQLASNFPSLMGGKADLALFAVAFGLCNAVPALPVLVAILNEMQLNRRRIGAVALASAAIGDAILWGSIAVILPVAAGAAGGTSELVGKLALALGGGVAAVLVCSAIINPLLQHAILTKAPERVKMILVGVAIFVCSALTQVSGLHAVLGSFIVGVMLPDSVRHMAADKLDMPTSMLLLPFFFLDTGLLAKVSIGDQLIWTVFAVGMVVCLVGKVVSCLVIARLAGENAAFGMLAGILLQTKGLMELVIVTVFRDVGIVSGETYSALVLVALASTALTMPLSKLVLKAANDRIEASGKPKPAAGPVVRVSPHQPTGRES